MQEGYVRAIDREILSWLDRPVEHLTGFYAMMRYQLGLEGANGVSAPQTQERRLHGRLCLAASEAVGGAWRDALRAAVAIELLAASFHMHQDIEEKNPTLRGQAATWNVWGAPQAINTGDGMFPLAAQAMLEAVKGAEMSLTLSRGLADTWLSLTRGQDMVLSPRDHEAGLDPYIEAAELRMGAIAGFSVEAGATIGGAAEELTRALRSFGARLGVAWQLRDDLVAASIAPRAGDVRHPLLTEAEIGSRLAAALRALERCRLPEPGRRLLEAVAQESAQL